MNICYRNNAYRSVQDSTSYSLVLVYMRKQKLARIEGLSLFVGMGMIIVLGAAVVGGVIQKAITVR